MPLNASSTFAVKAFNKKLNTTMSSLNTLMCMSTAVSDPKGRILALSGLTEFQGFPIRHGSFDTFHSNTPFNDQWLQTPVEVQAPGLPVKLTYKLVQMSSPSTMKVVQILSLKLQQNPSEIYEIAFPQNVYGPQEITISKNNDPIVIITLAKDYSGSGIGNGKEIGGGEAGKRDIKEEIQDSYNINIKYKTDKMFDIMAADEASYQEAIKVIETLYNIYFTNTLPSSAASIADIL